MENVFVYGTLKRGKSNYKWMENAGGQFISEASLIGARMFSMKYFPAITFPKDTSQGDLIKGELFSVQDISVLDRLEGYPRYYNRKQVETSEGLAWVYFMDEEKTSELERVPSGIWD